MFLQGNFDYNILVSNFTNAKKIILGYLNVEALLLYKSNDKVEGIGNLKIENITDLAYRVIFSGKPVCIFNQQISNLFINMNKQEIDKHLVKLLEYCGIYFILCLYGESESLEQAFEICDCCFAKSFFSVQKNQLVLLRQENSQAKSFVTGCAELSHEFKNPLNVMLTSIQLLRMKLKQKASEDFDNEYAQFLTFTEDNIMKITRLSSNFLDGARLHAGVVQLSTRMDNFCEIINRSVEQMSIVGENYGVKLELKNKTKHGEFCFFDDVKIDKIILNLLSNSIYSICAAKTKNGKVVIEITDDKDFFYVSVKDNGTGIDEEHVDCLFDAFFTKTKIRAMEGAGLGLAICKSLVILHRGVISVKPLKKGTSITFSVYKHLTDSIIDEDVLNSAEKFYNAMYYESIAMQELTELESKIKKIY